MHSSLLGSKRQATRNPLQLAAADVPPLPPAELLEKIQKIELGRIPTPTLHLGTMMGDEVLYLLGPEAKENWDNFLLVYHARLSSVPVTLTVLTEEDWDKNRYARDSLRGPRKPIATRFLDEHELATVTPPTPLEFGQQDVPPALHWTFGVTR